jgi:hypothetical protein
MRLSLCGLLTALLAPAALAQSVLTQDYDNARSGANLAETILTPGNVSSATFGKVFSYPVDEETFAQPLYVPNLLVNGSVHNVVIIATMNNTVYAYDADNPATATTPLWQVNLGAATPSSRFQYRAGGGAARNGILATPVIDPTSNTIYVVSQRWDSGAQTITFLLHALDLLSGTEKSGSPVAINPANFNTLLNIQRVGLLLLNGYVYVATASHVDSRVDVATGIGSQPYYGQVLAYNAQTLALTGTFNASSGGMGVGIWQGGRGLVSDGTYIYAGTGNAFTPGTPDYSESFVKLNPGTLTVADYFPDTNQACMNSIDMEISSSGPQIMNSGGTSLLLGGGKQGKVWALSLNQPLLGQPPNYFWGTTNYLPLPAEGGICKESRTFQYGWLHGSDTAVWNNPSGPSYFYVLGDWDQLRSFQASGNTFTLTSADTVVGTLPNALALSANGGDNAILWTLIPQASAPAILAAWNAVPSGGHLTKLWDSSQVPTRDTVGTFGKFSVPTVARGKVYVGTGSNQVAVYGLLPTTAALQISLANPTLRVVALKAISEKITINAFGGMKGAVNVTVSGLPPGATYLFTKTQVNLTKKVTSANSNLTIYPATATLPMDWNYTVVVTATSVLTGASVSAPLRLVTRSGLYSAVTKIGCNELNQMSAQLTWQISGSGTPSVWIQDPLSPNFPGRPWRDPAGAQGSQPTGYTITNKTSPFLYWLMDLSAGNQANWDNAVGVTNVGKIYVCP